MLFTSGFVDDVMFFRNGHYDAGDAIGCKPKVTQ